MEKEEPIEPKMHRLMNDIGHIIAKAIKDCDTNYGFALLVFPFGHGADHRINYISNANREDMLATMKEFIARVEGRHVENNTRQ